MKLDVVIVNWNAGTFLKDCVESVIKYKNDLVGQIVVVDNLSTDDSLLPISRIPEITLIKNPKNFGFGRACNVGAKICENKYILFLNPDARIYEGTLASCLQYLENDEHELIGILGVPLEESNGAVSKSCSRFPSITSVFSGAIGLDRIVPSLGGVMREWNHADTMEVDQVIGAFFLVRKKVFDRLKGFDERFFVYYEEVDFSYRARREGYKSVLYAGTKAFHYGGVSSTKAISDRMLFSLQSKLKYFYKNHGTIQAALVLFIEIVIELPARIFSAIFIKRSGKLLLDTVTAFLKFIQSLFKK